MLPQFLRRACDVVGSKVISMGAFRLVVADMPPRYTTLASLESDSCITCQTYQTCLTCVVSDKHTRREGNHEQTALERGARARRRPLRETRLRHPLPLPGLAAHRH